MKYCTINKTLRAMMRAVHVHAATVTAGGVANSPITCRAAAAAPVGLAFRTAAFACAQILTEEDSDQAKSEPPEGRGAGRGRWAGRGRSK